MLFQTQKDSHFSAAQLFHSEMAQGAAFNDHITSRSYPIDFSNIRLIRAESKKAKRLWNMIVAKYHYLGYTGTVGRYIRYFICDCSKLNDSKSTSVDKRFHDFINGFTMREINDLIGFKKVPKNSNLSVTHLSKSHIGAYLRFGWLFRKASSEQIKDISDNLFQPIIGCISGGSATYSCAPRDYILNIHTLSKHDRDRYLKYIANNWRFLILGRWHNLASHVLSIFSKVLEQDWQIKYNNPLIAIESFIVKSRFDGASYLANRWLRIGETLGFSKSGSISQNRVSLYNHGEKKYIYLKLLSKFSTNNDKVLIKIKRRNKKIMEYINKGYKLFDVLERIEI